MPSLSERSAKRPLRLVLAGGGTSGHVNPALAMGQAFQELAGQAEVRFIGVRGRAEEVIVPKAGLPIQFVPASPYCSPRRPLGFSLFVLRLLGGCLKAAWLLWLFKPDYLLSTGGYAAAPVVLAQLLLRRLGLSKARIVIHEANAIPGRFNQFMVSRADHLFLTFAQKNAGQKQGRVVGYPVRQTLASLPRQEALDRLGLKLEAGTKLVLVFGGSQGARTINRAVIEALEPLVRAKMPLFVLHAIGLGGKDHQPRRECQELLASLYGASWPERFAAIYRSEDYLHDMAAAYSAADLVVCRAGAGALHEISSLGKAALLIPKPNLPGDHQVHNARTLAAHGGAEVLYEDVLIERGQMRAGLRGETLAERIIALLAKPERLEELGRNSRLFLAEDAAGAIARLVLRPDEPQSQPVAQPILPPPPSHDGLIAMLTRAYKRHPKAYDPQALIPDPDELTYYRRRSSLLLLEPAWPLRNQGVKLVGLLKDSSKIPHLIHLLTDRRPARWLERLFGGDFVQVGFIRRNALFSLMLIDQLTPELEAALKVALADPYFEVRSAAAEAVAHFQGRLSDPASFQGLLVANLKDRCFEVVQHSALALGRIGLDEGALKALLGLKHHHFWQVRQAGLIALKELVQRKVATDLEKLTEEVTGFVITATDFRPHFSIKAAYQDLLEVLRKEQG